MLLSLLHDDDDDDDPEDIPTEDLPIGKSSIGILGVCHDDDGGGYGKRCIECNEVEPNGSN